MSSTGLLVVSNVKQFGQTLRSIEKYVHSLYVHLNIPVTLAPVSSWGRLIAQLYVDSNVHFNNIDMNILVTPLKQIGTFEILDLHPIDMLFSDAHHPEICENIRQQLRIEKPIIYLADESCNDLSNYQQLEPEDKIRMYDNVVLGGTFDRIHLGHKIFLSQAVVRTCCRLVVGVTTSQLTKSKTLKDLILPVERRIENIQKFLNDIDSTIRYEVVPIDDAFGPTKSDPNMDMIVVSAETLRGGQKVNEIRQQNNLKTLDIFCVDIVEATHKVDGPKECKVSSSNRRIDILGTRWRQPEPKPNLPAEPYVIGLTGGIASGKSKMAKHLASMGAFVMDCDKIAHEIYEPGQVCYDRVVQYFGEDILDENGRIDRTKLGPIVFGNPSELEKLNSIVWPEIMTEVKRRLKTLAEKENPPQVVILEAALLLKADWDQEVHEVWSMIVPPEEAVRRVVERNGLTEEEAKQRLAGQMSNDETVARSHIIFSSLWDPEFTLKQAEKAWNLLIQELKARKQQNQSNNL